MNTGTKPIQDRVQTLNANRGVGGKRIAKDRYASMRQALLDVIPRNKAGVLAQDLPKLVRPRLPATVYPPSVSVPWYTVTVKLDLEARNLIERLPGATPQRVRRTGAK